MKLNRAILNVVILSWGYAVVSSIQSWAQHVLITKFPDCAINTDKKIKFIEEIESIKPNDLYFLLSQITEYKIRSFQIFYVVHYDKWDCAKSGIIFDMAFVICSIIAPSYVILSGTRVSIFTIYICHVFYISSFLWPEAKLMYAASAVLGLGAALVFIVQGQCLTENNNPCTIHRHASIFWLFYQIFLLSRDLVIRYFLPEVYDRENFIVTPLNLKVCVFIIIISIIIGLALQEPPREYSSGGLECIPNGNFNESQEQPEGLFYTAWKPLKHLLGLAVSIKMFHLSLILAYAGLMQNLRHFKYGDDETNEMTDIYVRIGEIFGALFSAFCFCNKKGDSTLIDMMGFAMLISSFSLISCASPQNKDNSVECVEGLSSGKLYYYRSMALIERFSFGVGDACLHTQIYSLLGALYPKNSASVFALAGLYYWVGYSCGYHYVLDWQLRSQLSFFFVTGTLVLISTIRVEIHYINRTSDPETKTKSLPGKIADMLKHTTDLSPKIKMMYAALFNNMKKQREILQEKPASIDVPIVEILSEK